MTEKLFEEIDDLSLQLKKKNDTKALKTFREVKEGKNMTLYEEVVKKLGL